MHDREAKQIKDNGWRQGSVLPDSIHEVPAHHNAQAYLDAYIEAAGIIAENHTPLFRTVAGRNGRL